MTFVAAKDAEAKLLNVGYAFEQATKVRQAPSFTNPSMFRCVEGSTFYAPHHCHPGDLASPTADGPNETATAGDVGGTVPATLSLTLGAPATFGAFTPGVAREYTAASTATVISTAGDATLSVSDPGHLMNGAFSLPQPLRVEFSKATWTAPVSNDVVAVTFKQAIGANDALRTGSYSKTLTFTLATTKATVISTAGDAKLSVSDPGSLMNGAFSLPQPLRVEFSKATWTAPVANELVDVTFKQAIGANDALRTGSYSKTLTFTLSTTMP